MTSEPALTFTEKDRTELAMLADDYDAVPNAHDGRLIARAAAYIEQLESALAADGPAPAEEARAIEAHICLEARRVCTCNAIDTPHGPAPDEKTPGCPVHSPAPAEEARVDQAVIDAINLYGDEELHKALDAIGWPAPPTLKGEDE